jgi:uncharacterized spore protein YtfJ
MENIENLVKGTANEMEKLLASKTVVGDPIVIEGNTIIPLISLGFGFGAGGGTGSGKADAGQAGEGTGGGTGGGGGVKPVAIIIVNQDGVRVEPVRGNPSGLERIGDAIGRAFQARRGNSQEE